jgi:16S rRNA (guanine966-N2)-methyltransferase
VDAEVLDVYAGTGAVGFEAISRGASHATFIESHRQTAAAIVETAQKLGVAERVRVIHASAERAAPRLRGTYGFVYLDPPYADLPPIPLLCALSGMGAIDVRTILVYEHGQTTPCVRFPGFTIEREARYGEAVLQFMRVDD